MDRLSAFLTWVRATLFRSAADREMDEELRFHLEMETEHNLRAGIPPAEARRRALVAFGGVERHRESLRKFRATPIAEPSLRDLRLAIRSLARTPGFTATVVLILALVIGMTTAMFTAFDAVILRPLPVTQPDRLVMPRGMAPNGIAVSMSPDDLSQLRAAARGFSGAVGVAHQGSFDTPFRDGDRMIALRGALVTGGFFDLLGVRPAVGRLFGVDDEVPNASPSSVIVLSYDTWRTVFDRDSTVIGRKLTSPHGFGDGTIVGVAPPGLAYPAGAEYWAPVAYGSLDVVARLTPDATPAIAAEEFVSILQRLRQQGGEAPLDLRPDIVMFADVVLGDVRPALQVLVAAITLLLLIAFVNVGGLVLLRAMRRRSETALRRALGAGTIEIVRPSLWENGLLCVVGGLLGLGIAQGLLITLARMAPPELPRLDVLRLSTAPLGFTILVSLASLMVAGILPVALMEKGGIASDLRTGRRGRHRHALEKGLVTTQIALSLILVAGAGLLVRSLDRLGHLPLGYRSDGLSIIHLAKVVDIPKEGWFEPMGQLYDHAAPEIQKVPGVVSLTPINFVPFHGPEMFSIRWRLPRQTDAEAASSPPVPYEIGGPDYFRTLDIPLLRGREFTENDRTGAPLVAVISRSVAELFWPGEDPIGKQLAMVGSPPPNTVTIVGEAEDTRYRQLRNAGPTVYLPWRQVFFQGYVAIRTSRPLPVMLPALQEAVRAGDPAATIALAETVDQDIASQLALPRLSAWLASVFGMIALVLAAIGVFGITAFVVQERFHEFGIRSALGATPGRIQRSVLAQASWMTALGAAIGLTGSVAATRFLRGLLFEVDPTDPLVLAGASGLLLIVVLGAAYLPASMATRADPIRALRSD